jgi:hypothetical protein
MWLARLLKTWWLNRRRLVIGESGTCDDDLKHPELPEMRYSPLTIENRLKRDIEQLSAILEFDYLTRPPFKLKACFVEELDCVTDPNNPKRKLLNSIRVRDGRAARLVLSIWKMGHADHQYPLSSPQCEPADEFPREQFYCTVKATADGKTFWQKRELNFIPKLCIRFKPVPDTVGVRVRRLI